MAPSATSSAVRAARRPPRRSRVAGRLGALPLACAVGLSATVVFSSLPQVPGFAYPAAVRSGRAHRVARGVGAVLEVKNPVKTVAETVGDFYKLYQQPPLLPMYRTFFHDLLKQIHLTVVDSRFKYDAIFALGAWETFSGLMSNYDKLGGSAEADKIWPAYMRACGLDPDKVKADAEAVVQWSKSVSPAQILETMEGSATTADQRILDAFSGISTGLYSQPFGIGLFKMMEYSGVQLSSDSAEEWAKALKISPSKPAGDLETYRKNQNKLKQAEEMMREVEIREKKKLAERLEEKAKALAAKAAEKLQEAQGAKETAA